MLCSQQWAFVSVSILRTWCSALSQVNGSLARQELASVLSYELPVVCLVSVLQKALLLPLAESPLLVQPHPVLVIMDSITMRVTNSYLPEAKWFRMWALSLAQIWDGNESSLQAEPFLGKDSDLLEVSSVSTIVVKVWGSLPVSLEPQSGTWLPIVSSTTKSVSVLP